MKTVRWWAFLLAVMLSHGGLALAAADYKIVTASERGTYIKIGRDLAGFVAPPADVALEVLPSAGSVDNVRRLRYEAGVKFALVQSDVYQSFLDMAAAGNAEAGVVLQSAAVSRARGGTLDAPLLPCANCLRAGVSWDVPNVLLSDGKPGFVLLRSVCVTSAAHLLCGADRERGFVWPSDGAAAPELL